MIKEQANFSPLGNAAIEVSDVLFNSDVIESIGDCVQVLDIEGRLLAMNEVGQNLMRIGDIQPYLGTTFCEFCEGRDTDDARHALAEAQQGRQARFTGFAATGDGTPKWWDVVITPILDNQKKINRLLVVSRDITAQKQAGEALARSEQLLRQAQAYAHIGNWSLEADGTTAYWSNEIYRILGFEPTIPAGPATLKKSVHPDDLARVTASLMSALKEGCEHNMEYRVFSPDGKMKWVACKASPVFDETGKLIRLQGIFQDITERKLVEEQTKASLQEKEILLREIHHRVMNNLQVVSSLLSLQAMQTSNKEAADSLRESCRRVQVMAEVHNRLYRSSDISQIRFDAFIASLADDIISSFAQDSFNVRLDADLEPLTLDIDTAIPCGLIISELVSNCVKHAFPGRSEGTIRIKFNRHGKKLRLQIDDDGIGISSEPGRNGSLGLKLVKALVDQLQGDIAYSGTNGTNVRISI